MTIQTVIYTSADNDCVNVTYDDLSTLIIPVDHSRYQEVLEWVGLGNTIDPYVAPTPTALQNAVDDVISNGVTRKTLLAAIYLAEAEASTASLLALKGHIDTAAVNYGLTTEEIVEAL